jgi:hypothetical protein
MPIICIFRSGRWPCVGLSLAFVADPVGAPVVQQEIPFAFVPRCDRRTQQPTPTMKRLSLPQAVALLLCVSLLSTVVLIICSSDLGSGGTTQPQQQQHRTPRERLRSALNVVRTAVNHTSAALACRDSDGSCASWARTGECSKNAKFMNVSCKRSCGLCPSILGGGEAGSARPRCEDASSFCGQWAAVGECDSNPLYMRHNCPVTCHLCQSSRCHDVDTQSCAAQARAGKCRAEPQRMYEECRWTCKWCAMEKSSRCRRAVGEAPAARQGTIEYMFSRAISSPEHAPLRPVVHSRDPWIVTFEDFLSHEESQRIIDIGGRGWQRSQAGDGVQAVRTSSTAWCDPGSCQRDPVLARIRKRISNLTLVPERNAEHMQVLKYDTGQFYRTHHDQNSPQTSAWGPRMYTVRVHSTYHYAAARRLLLATPSPWCMLVRVAYSSPPARWRSPSLRACRSAVLHVPK